MRTRTRILLKRTLRNTLLTLLIPTASLLTLRLAWGLEASHHLAKARAQLKSEGIPCSEAELPNPQNVPPDEDAVAPFLKLLADFKIKGDGFDPNAIAEARSSLPSDTPYSEAQLAELKRFWEANESVINRLDSLETRSRYAWPTSYDFYMGAGDGMHYGSSFSLERMLEDQAKNAVSEHRDADALRYLRRILLMARIFDANHLLISMLVASSYRLRTAELLDDLLPKLTWNDPDVRTQADLLLHALSKGDRVEFFTVWGGETVFFDQQVRSPGNREQWWLAPLLDDDESAGFSYFSVNAPAARATTYQQARSLAVHATSSAVTSAFAFVVHPYTHDMSPDADNISALQSRRASAVRATVLILAAYLYRQEDGVFPADAIALIPKFIPTVPPDPFAPHPLDTMHYRLDPSGPTVWSVGENMTDENARLDPTNGRDPLRRHADIVFGAAWHDMTAKAATTSAPAPL